MAVFIFLLALILALAGGGALVASIDLMPTDVGLLYAGCGVIALSSACIVVALGALIVRLDRIGARVNSALLAEEAHLALVDAHPVAAPSPSAAVAERSPSREISPLEPEKKSETDGEEPVNENRAGHLPTLEQIEETIAHPEPPPRLIGRYSAGGANYAIYADGSVEAEMAEGQYNFASMNDFRAFLENRREQGTG